MLRLGKYSICLLATTIFYVAPAHAQATRTWVSGVGDDVNPCSRTAPCKTFAGAISKTAAGGEIDCLDPGGFGAVTITKSITIDCDGTFGSILASGVNGININDSASGFPNTINVIIHGLSINGAGGGAQNAQGNPGTGVIGINFVSGASLVVEDVIIQRFNASTAAGIRVATGGNSQTSVRNTVIADNGLNASTGGGILVVPTGAGNARVTLSNVLLSNNLGFAVRGDTAGGGSGNPAVNITIDNSVMDRNTNGLSLNGPAINVFAMLVNSTVNSNTSAGISASGGGSVIRVGNTTITNNGTGVSLSGGAVAQSYGTNRLNGNTTDGAFTPPVISQQ